jgi:hypothetical protein
LKSSARSALTERSDSLTLVLTHPEVKLGYTSCARSAQAKESLSCESELSIEGLLLQVCAESGELNTRKWLRIAARIARKSLREDSEFGGSPGGIRLSSSSREGIDCQESVGRISEIPLALRSSRGASGFTAVSRVQAPEIVECQISFKHPLAIGSTRSCMEFKLCEQEEENSDERCGHWNFGIREIGSHEDE